MGRLTVPAGASDLLVVGFQAFRQIEMDDKADIGFIYSHAERDCRHYDLNIVADEEVLVAGALLFREARVIGSGGVSLLREKVADLLGLLPGEAVYNPRLTRIPAMKFEELIRGASFGTTSRKRLGLIKAADEFRLRCEGISGYPADTWPWRSRSGPCTPPPEIWSGLPASWRYSGRKSWPHSEMQCASSTARQETSRR